MALDINGYSGVFKSFVDFAQRKFAERETKAIADATLESATLSGRKVVAVKDAEGDFVHKWSRGLNVTIANDRTRTLFRNAVARRVYKKQTDAATAKGVSNCPDCVLAHDANSKRIYTFGEMEADHVTAWSKGGDTSEKNCQMLCKHHNRVKGNC